MRSGDIKQKSINMRKNLIFAINVLFLVLLHSNNMYGQNDGRCFPQTEVQSITKNIQDIICGDTLTPVNGNLDDGDYVITINGFMEYFNKNGTVDPTLLKDGDEVCITAFTYDLVTINEILNLLYIDCQLGACDIFPPIIHQVIKAIVCGENDGVPGINSIQELVDFLKELSWFPIRTIPEAYDIIDATNDEISNDYGIFCYASYSLCGIYDEDYECPLLPIELKSFEGKETNCQMRLTWETANERNFSHFEIQKSHSGTDFHTISRVESINDRDSNSGIYNYTDVLDIKPTNYYRLKIVDKDYSYVYSDIIALTSKCIENDNFPTVSVYPNPVKGNSLFIQLTAPVSADNVKIHIIDQLGRSIIEHDISITEGPNQLEIKVNTLDVHTVYFLKIASNEWSTSIQRFVKG